MKSGGWSMPSEAQDDIAQIAPQLAGADDETSPETLSPEERASITASRAATCRGEYATDAQVRAVWTKHGL
jgi:hypothetical protein